MLYDPALHEPLTDVQWDAEHVRGAIRSIVADVDRAYDADAFWPAQEWDGSPVHWRALGVGPWALGTELNRQDAKNTKRTGKDLACRSVILNPEFPAPAGNP